MISVTDKIRRGRMSDRSKSDEWFAWYPVYLGVLGTGELVWLEKLWRNRCCGATIYQRLDA